MSGFYENKKEATVIGGGIHPAGYIKVCDHFYIQVNRRPTKIHMFMMRIFFGWKWVRNYILKTDI